MIALRDPRVLLLLVVCLLALMVLAAYATGVWHLMWPVAHQPLAIVARHP